MSEDKGYEGLSERAAANEETQKKAAELADKAQKEANEGKDSKQ
jgi:hypothetical protein